MAEIYIVEENNTWQGDSPVKEILELLDHNPFGSFSQMQLNHSLKWQPYNYSKAFTALKRGKEPAVGLKVDEPFWLEGSIARGDWRNVVRLEIDNESLPKLNLEKLFKYIGQIARLFPKFLYAQIKTDYDIKEFYDKRELEWVPACFNDFLSWYHLISPLAYEAYYTRTELLAVPAHSVRELDNGWIEIISYADPLSYDQPETRECIITITQYLNAHRHDWQKKPVLVG